MERAILRVLLAAIQVLALCLPACAQQSGRETPSGKFADQCSDRLYRRGADREMPPAIRAHLSELEQQLHPADLRMEAGKSELGCLPVAEAWPHPHTAAGKPRVTDRANLYLVLFETIIRENYPGGGWRDTPQSLAMALVALPAAGAHVSGDAADLSVVAKTPQPLERKGELGRFDFAPYRLNEDETAFGLRSTFNTTYIGGGGKDEVLELFRVKDGAIESILRTLMASSSVRRAVFEGDPKGAVIRVLPTKTNGMFDLKKSVHGGRSAIYRWNGQRYETHDLEPVKCFNEPCDDIKRELAMRP